MSASEMRAWLVTGLGRLRSRVDGQAKRRTERLQASAASDPRVPAARAFATGLVLGRLVNRLGR